MQHKCSCVPVTRTQILLDSLPARRYFHNETDVKSWQKRPNVMRRKYSSCEKFPGGVAALLLKENNFDYFVYLGLGD